MLSSIQIYRIIGGVFVVLGLISLMNTVAGFAIHGELLWRSALCTIIDFCVAAGFFGRHRWLLPILFVNVLAQATLVSVRYAAHPDLSLLYFPLFGFALAAALFVFVFRTRTMLRWNVYGYLAAAGFLVSWGILFSYTVVRWLA